MIKEDSHSISEKQCCNDKGKTDDGGNKASLPVQSVEEFKEMMYKMQGARRLIVGALLRNAPIKNEWEEVLHSTYMTLIDSCTQGFQCRVHTSHSELLLNIRDEITGLAKDLKFLELLHEGFHKLPKSSTAEVLSCIDLSLMLEPYHPVSTTAFHDEQCATVNFLREFVALNTDGKKPIFVTDWDGTMKDYCSQYITNLQPIYSAVGMTRFLERFTRLSAVLTAGPLSGIGILHLTAMPINGPVLFSGSWGREWYLNGKRVVHTDGISDEGFSALEMMEKEVDSLLRTDDYSVFEMVGSGVQRKVDRLTLGVQTVCGHVPPELSRRYQEEIKKRVHRVDPENHILVFNPSTSLEVEVVAHNSGTVWNKADGVDRVIIEMNDSLEGPGKVLICGDTRSDLPMVKRAAARNPDGVMAIFVGLNEELRDEVRDIVGDDCRCCFVSCPDVIHASMALLLNEDIHGTM
uniref:T6PP_N domain-containing protein n=1 Tax=Syphacia muris TaxID=451379 RepID=A0A0N5B021_9BILA